MTDSIDRVSGAQGASRGGGQGDGGYHPPHGQRKRPPAEPVADVVDISRAARERQGGKEKKSIFDFIRELLG